MKDFCLERDLDFKNKYIQEKIKEILQNLKDNNDKPIFSEVKVLGNGTYGIVFEDNYSLYPEGKVAIKLQLLDDDEKKEKETKILKIMNQLNSLAFDILSVKYFENIDITDHNGNQYNIIIEEKADTDLEKMIQEKKNNNTALTNDEKKQISKI